MANERALGVAFILAAQTWRQFVVCYGEDEARTIYGLSNNLVAFGGGKDIRFYQELSDLIGATTHTETRHTSRGAGMGGWFGTTDRSWDQRRVPILEPAELRRIEQRQALVLAETYEPIIATLRRCIDGRSGRNVLAAQSRARLAAHSVAADVHTDHRHDASNAAPSTTAEPTVTNVTTETVVRTSQRLGLPDQKQRR